MSTPYIVKVLAERPEAELRATQAEARAKIVEQQVVVDQIDQALQFKAQQARRTSRPARKPSRSGDTREGVLNAIGTAGSGTISPSQIVAAVQAGGSTVTAGAIRNMIRRLVDEREVEKVRDGEYRLASRNGNESNPFMGPPENGASQPLSAAGQPQEGT